MMSLRKLYIIGVLALAFSVLFFSWLPHPSFRELSFFPNWLVRWTDKYGNLRTAIPFIPLSVFLKVITRTSNGKILLICITLSLLAELGQLLLPLRSFDIGDILYALFGAVIGLLLELLFDTFRKKSSDL
ncbi:MAG: VanZ family protein [Flectobacillus sp.]|nr:VanZ family protein [Flectobacillus sp.]